MSLASFIAANDTLRTLCLEWNSAGLFDRGMEALVEALKDNRCLTSLDLRNNKIGPDGGVALGHMLSQNLTLASLGTAVAPVGCRAGPSQSERRNARVRLCCGRPPMELDWSNGRTGFG